VLLKHREPSAAALWIVFIAVTPLLGPVVYALMGIHRVNRRHMLQGQQKAELRARYASVELMESRKRAFRGTAPPHVLRLSDAVGHLSHRSLLRGNRLDVLVNGEEAYPKMLAAIDAAKEHVHLLSYIFDDDPTGREFVRVLASAASRGVEVRVIFDAVGAFETGHSLFSPLRRSGGEVAVARPLKLTRWRRGLHFRNHRKILVVDGSVAFTGGMNLSSRYLAQDARNKHRCRDFHFRVQGPVITQLQEVFIEDWFEATKKAILDDRYFPLVSAEGHSLCRVVSSSPAGEYEHAHALFFQAICCAQRRIEIVTPYFIPDLAIYAALRAAIQRGVHVEVLIPGEGDSPFVQAAMFGRLPELLAIGINVFVRKRPFLHAKAMVVDDEWATVGTANFDARSFRFLDEVNLEVIDPEFVKALCHAMATEKAESDRWTAQMLSSRPLQQRLKERAAALFSPTL
jgi:cardiolipin synthase